MKYYEYHVAYHHSTGTGSCVMLRRKKINSAVDVVSVQKFIEEQTGLKNVGLTNFIFLRKVRAD